MTFTDEESNIIYHRDQIFCLCIDIMHFMIQNYNITCEIDTLKNILGELTSIKSEIEKQGKGILRFQEEKESINSALHKIITASELENKINQKLKRR